MSEIPRRHHGCCTDHARSWLAPGLAWCTELRHWRNVRAAQSQQPAGSYPPWAGIHAKGGAAPNSEAPLSAAAFAWCVSSRRWCIRERGTSARRMAHGAATNPAMFVLSPRGPLLHARRHKNSAPRWVEYNNKSSLLSRQLNACTVRNGPCAVPCPFWAL
jgi:hypothetical protein